MNEDIHAADRTLRAAAAQMTGGLSPAALALAWFDWAVHFTTQPARGAELLALPLAEALGGAMTPSAINGHDTDRRMADPAWDAWPFNLYRQAYQASGQWLAQLTEGVPGVDRHHAQVVAFAARLLHGIGSPANSPFTHPKVLEAIAASGGMNLLQGAQHWAQDLQRSLAHLPPVGADAFVPGRDVAVTPGKVVFRNHLMELIQYAPTTPTVFPEPVLMMSAWIMKYYILDLSPHNSLIRHLVDKGHTVFAISWRNPDANDRDLGIDDYLAQGLMAALDAIAPIVPGRRVHALGYCLGGTLLAIGAAAMARERDTRLASLTLLAAQTDFTEPGELAVFIDESQLAFLEDLMARQGYLDASQMAGAFALLRADELIWSQMVRSYFLGERLPLTDLMAWNADGTRMPARMHADYLRSLFLENALAQGHYRVNGQPVSLGDIEVPVFAVGTRTDHVAPWRSVHKLHLLCDTDIRFVLTDGGHNAGMLSEPGHPHRSYQVLDRPHDTPYVPPDQFLARAERVEGSWWPALDGWLAAHSGPRRKPPPTGHAKAGDAPFDDAPGCYVLQH